MVYVGEQGDVTNGRFKKWAGIFLYALLGLVVVSVIWFATFRPILVLPRIRLSPGYLLRDQQDKVITSEDLRGRFTLYSFTYGGCEQDNCPLSLAQIADVHQFLNEAVPTDMPFSLVTMTLDPVRETAGALAAQIDLSATAASAVPWVIAAGDPLRTKYVVGSGFRVFYEEEAAVTRGLAPKINFTPRYVLVDPNGIIRAEYRTAVLDLDILRRDIGLLDEEMRNSQGFGRYGYEAAHLFVCYP